ncbi:MAG: hypothetical protein HY906_08185 [Deltaproteobacteria bacterium]|nr:hypothetical protein [Deltaproteobacteria bacterium]
MARGPGGGSYYPGTLGCRPDCVLDASGCGGYCGDGVRQAGEACDGHDFGGLSCADSRVEPALGAPGRWTLYVFGFRARQVIDSSTARSRTCVLLQGA